MLFKRKGIAGALERVEKAITSFLFFPRLAISENLTDYIRKNPINGDFKRAVLLANGPSLKRELLQIKESLSKLDDCLFIGINDFSLSEDYSLLKPKAYVLSDSKYFMETSLMERSLKSLHEINVKTTWKMNIYVPFKHRDSFLKFSAIDNPNIHVIPFHSIRFWGLEKIRMYVYKWGLGNGEFGTVIINAIYVALVLGFKKLYLFGVDHTFFDGLHVDKKNRLCYIYNHFDSTEPEVKPMMSHHDGVTVPFTMYDFLTEKLDVWHGHEVMKDFSKFMGAEIINCTENSMIDTYKRGTLED